MSARPVQWLGMCLSLAFLTRRSWFVLARDILCRVVRLPIPFANVEAGQCPLMRDQN
jgi:hypothetical protein